MKQPVFALVDCNNFFVSCEQVFRPDLANQPVAVLSNNDGCIVARSDEAKQLGIPMGAPEFKYRSVLRQNQVQMFSANFPMYGEFSRRIVDILSRFTPYIEVYSIDESFLEVSSLLIPDYELWAKQVRSSILKELGIPVSIGIATSKTLAKAATEMAKSNLRHGGVFSFVGQSRQQTRLALSELPVEDIWGIGRRLAPKLRQLNIKNAAELSAVTTGWAKQNLSVKGERLVRELQGQSCYGLSRSSVDDGQKSIAATRSFGRTVRAQYELEIAIASFTARAAVRLRRKHQIASAVTVFINTNFGYKQQWNPSFSHQLSYPTADTSVLIEAAIKGLERVYNPDFGYRRAGVILHGLLPETAQQTTMSQSGQGQRLSRRDKMMTVMDQINQRYGTSTLKTAAEGAKKAERWHSKRELRSPGYTYNWDEIAVIR